MDLRETTFVSVVTPFYNNETYLEECIQSVLAQTHTNFEYLLVNNCSKDRSLDIAQQYAAQDRRIKLFSNETFLTQIQNFNSALMKISGVSKYCKMVQGDDWMYPECLERMIHVGENFPSVGVISSYCLKGKEIGNDGLDYTRIFFKGQEVCRIQLLGKGSYFGTPTTVMFRSEIVRSRYPNFFSEGRPHNEDAEACYEILKDWDFGFVHQVLTYSRVDNESLTSKIIDYNPYLLDAIIFLKKYGPIYLSESERSERGQRLESEYYRYISFWIPRKEGRSFLRYHTDGLKTIDEKIRWSQIVKHWIIDLLDIFLNPGRSTKRCFSKIFKTVV
jgi:glycosyltransferase involved in cell wall biosynthesis